MGNLLHRENIPEDENVSIEETFARDEDGTPSFEEPHAHRTGPTGPTSPTGKAISRLNSITHGCCSKQTVLRHEDPAEYEFTMNFWLERYQPENTVAALLVEETARAHWLLKRNQKRLEDVEWRLPGDAWCWTEANQKLFQNATRYKTTAERAFFRVFRELESHYDRLDRHERLQNRARDAAAKIQIKWLNEKEKLAAEKLKIEQVVYVETVDGKCQTSYLPSNEALLRQVAARPTPPLYLRRYVTFPCGIPPEYAWAGPNLLHQFTETIGLQMMDYESWLELIEKEKATGSGHIGPSPSRKRSPAAL